MRENKNSHEREVAQDVIKYMRAIKETSGKLVGYASWLKGSKHSGMARSNAYDVYACALVFLGNKPFEGLTPKRVKLYESFKFHANRFLGAAEDYMETVNIDGFSNKEWFLYFLSVAERKTKHIKIGRALVRTGEGRRVTLFNVNEGFSEDYEGEYDFIKDRKVVFFDLKNDPINTTRELHIKMIYHRHDSQIQLGTYTTFDEQRLYSGTMVFQQITGDEKLEELSQEQKNPVLCSYDYNSQIFGDIPSQIITYLSLKNRNYHEIPMTVPNLDELQVYLDEYKPIFNKTNRFLELNKPRLFIAIPTGKKDDSNVSDKERNKILSICSKLKGKLARRVEFNICESDQELDRDNSKPQESLLTLKRTRFFVLIMGDISEASFSLVQLGYALANCKYLMVVFKNKSVSPRILSFQSDVINKFPVDSIENSSEEIVDAIFSFVDRNM